MSLPTSMVYTAISAIIFAAVAFVTIRSIGKERAITKRTPLFSILIQLVFLGIYILLTRLDFSSMFFMPALLLGLIVGLGVGGATQVYRKQEQVFTKKRKTFLVFWILTVIINQALISFGIAEGIALVIFSTGNLIGSEGNMLIKITRAKPIPTSSTVYQKTPSY